MRLLCLALALSTSACASVPMAAREVDARAKELRAPAGAARLYVYRPAALMGTAIALDVFVDRAWVASLPVKTFAAVTLRPGEHVLAVRATGEAERTLVVEAGRSYFAEVAPTWGLLGTATER